MGSSATNKLGLLAGAGLLPAVVAANAAARGYEVHAYVFSGTDTPELHAAAQSVTGIPFCKVGELLDRMERDGIREIITIGSIAQTEVLNGPPQFDELTLSLWRKLPDRRVDSIMLALLGEMERRGIRALSLPPFLGDGLAGAGPLTRREPDPPEWDDIRFGFGLAKYIGGRDIGQTVVVKNRAVMAVEAVEGTDQAILRGGVLAREGGVVVKVAKPGQDLRFDIPAVGLTTLASMKESLCTVLAVEAGMVLVADRAALLAEADAAGIAIVGVREEETLG